MHVLTKDQNAKMKCSSLLLRFLLDYPLGTKRLQHHLDFLVTNLAYEHEEGRLTGLSTIKVKISVTPVLHLCGCLVHAVAPSNRAQPASSTGQLCSALQNRVIACGSRGIVGRNQA